MEIISTSGRGNFIIQDDAKKILELRYKGFFSSNAQAHWEGFTIDFKSQSFWGTHYGIFLNDQERGALKMGWSGKISIRLISGPQKEAEDYSFRKLGLLKSHFELLNQEEESIFVLKAKTNWRTLSANYLVEGGEGLESSALIELLIYAGFAANWYSKMMAAAG